MFLLTSNPQKYAETPYQRPQVKTVFLRISIVNPKTKCPRPKMQSRCINTNITKATFPTPRIEGVCGDSVRCCSGCSFMLCIINSELIVSSAWLTPPPPRLTINKHYISQDSIAIKGVLSLSCLRVLSRAFLLHSVFLNASYPYHFLFNTDKGT